jgi:hypothetical protein
MVFLAYSEANLKNSVDKASRLSQFIFFGKFYNISEGNLKSSGD